MPHALAGLVPWRPEPMLPLAPQGSGRAPLGPLAGGLSLRNGPLPEQVRGARAGGDASAVVGGLLRGPAGNAGGRPLLDHGPNTIQNRPLSASFAMDASAVAVEAPATLGDIPVVALALALWRLAMADPCNGFDGYANGMFKITHLPSVPMASMAEDARQTVGRRLLQRLQALPDDADGVIGMLGAVYASARQAGTQGWSAFQPQAAAIAALTDQAAVAAHFCRGMVAGRASVLGVELLFGQAILAADLSAQGLPPAVAAGQSDDALAPHLAEIATTLVKAGAPGAEAAAAARAVHDMQAQIAAASPDIDSVNLADAKASIGGFPWDAVWQVLELDAQHTIYIQPAVCTALGELMQGRSVGDWRMFLLYLEARTAAPFIDGANSPEARLTQMEQTPIVRQALGELYVSTFDQTRLAWSQALFDRLQATFIEDIEASPLDAADQAVLKDAFSTARLQLQTGTPAGVVAGIAREQAYLRNLQILQGAGTTADLASLRQTGPWSPPLESPHHLSLRIALHERMVRLSPAFLDALWESAADAELDARCGAIGTALGHELAHLIDVAPLSAAGQKTRAQQVAAIAQRADGRPVGDGYVDGARVATEVGADLRGASVARRACNEMALAQNRTFQASAFFQGAAQTHAAHPRASQLRARLHLPHPPEAVRADLLAEVKGFEDAFGCDPAPRRPYHRVI